MPFKSRKQEKWMWVNHPDIAQRWSNEYGSWEASHSYKKPKRKARPRQKKGTK